MGLRPAMYRCPRNWWLAKIRHVPDLLAVEFAYQPIIELVLSCHGIDLQVIGVSLLVEIIVVEDNFPFHLGNML